ncbi:c-type cytochrome [Primorskyibacter sp. S87]|uniref:c-type cytochrome n=1 Tax=Primorskyibacter sp. S87 TaxID=3415126 RepID=UPI003C7C54E0
MKSLIAAVTLSLFAAPAFAAGDAAEGEKGFKKCKSCHAIVDDAGEAIVKGGKTGPNLYGVIGRTAGTSDGFKYGADLVAAGEAGLVWDEANLAEFSMDPKAFLQAYLDSTSAKSKMSFKMKKGAEDVSAYLASVGAQ